MDPRCDRAVARGHRAGPERSEAAGRGRPRRHCCDALAAHARRAGPARPDGLEAGRMTLLGAIRPDDWDLPLFLHILGAMVLVGSLVLVVTSIAADNLRL